MRLAKDRLDIGLLTDDEAMLPFMSDEVGLRLAETLDIAPGVVQHRFDLDGSVVKVNVVGQLDTTRRAGYREILVASGDTSVERLLEGPDAVRVRRVPPGTEGVAQLGVRLHVRDRAAAQRYFAEALGWDTRGSRVALGDSVVLIEEDPLAPDAIEMPVRGWTYLTVQVHDCDAETEAAVARGAHLARPPAKLRDVARFSMLADPWGNQLEVSQRASLTGRPID